MKTGSVSALKKNTADMRALQWANIFCFASTTAFLPLTALTKMFLIKNLFPTLIWTGTIKKITDSFPKEENLQKAVEYGAGMKILRQEPWEATVSFIISQNNNISRIKAIIKRLSENYGTSINGAYFAFPTAEELKDVKAADYARLGCGYRADYLEETVKKMLDNKIDFDFLTSCGFAEARETLLKLKGIGPKVADCICLFGLNYLDAFPVDTWIKKVMETLFLKRSATNREIGEYAKNAFGEYAGLAQQYLFYYARENKIKGLE